jgi:hypothetical protein
MLQAALSQRRSFNVEYVMPNETPPASLNSHAPSGSPVFMLRHPYLWAVTPACALFAFSFAFSGAPLPQPLISASKQTGALRAGAVDTSAIIPASETFIVSPQSVAGYVLLRGRMQAPVGATVVAPTAGQIAQIAVRPGQIVQPGQQIAAISTGAVSRRAELAPVENRQSHAEAAQIAAAHRQQAWQQRVREAHRRLEAAQERVQAAQQRVALARDVVRRLQNGEAVSATELNTTSAEAPREAAPKKSSRRVSTGRGAARETTLRDSRSLQDQADAATQQAAAKRRAAEAADAIVKTKQKQWLAAQNIADQIAITPHSASTPASGTNDKATGNNSGDASKPTAVASSAQKHAAQDHANALKAESDKAVERATTLRREADRLEKRAAALRNKSNAASRRAAAALQSLRVFDNEGTADNATTTHAPSAARVARESTPSSASNAAQSAAPGAKVSVAEAARIARAAIAESHTAIADAERIRQEVESYERPVENTRDQFDAATRRLDAAQEHVWDAAAVASPNVRPVTTPGGGVVLWVAEVAREVQAGDPLAGVGRADRMEVVLQDTSGAWKNVRPGSMILALVQNEIGTASAQRGGAVMQPTVAGSALTSTPTMRGVPTLARVLGVHGPARPNAPAVVRIAIHNPRRTAAPAAGEGGAPAQNQDYGLAERAFAPGTPVVCSLPRPGAGTEIAIPNAAIRRGEDGNRYVAVLTPAADTAADISADLCRIAWRKVQVGRGDGFQNVITAGLEVGDRIALRPAAMQNFIQTHGAQATLRVEQA